MRILFVNEKCGHFGGVESNVLHTAQGLRALGHACRLAYGEQTRDPEAYAAAFEMATPVRELAPSNPDAPPTAALVEAWRPDVVYFHKVPLLAAFTGVMERCRCLRMVHDHDLYCPRRHKYYMANSRVCRRRAGWFCYLDGAFIVRRGGFPPFGVQAIGPKMRDLAVNRRLDGVLAASRFMRDQLLENGFAREQVHTIPLGTRFRDEPWRAPAESPHVLYVGQLVHGKGVDLFLRALARVKAPVTATIAGEGNGRDGLKALARKLGLAERVTFHGWLGPEELAAEYRGARIAVVPSRWPEPYGLVGIEAMGAGLPVVAFNVGGIPDWLEDGVTGLLVPEQDCDAMARAFDRLLADPAYTEQLSRNAHAHARERFRFEDYVAKLTAVLAGGGKEGIGP